MMKIQKHPDYLIFAQDSKSGELLDFPDVPRGWGITIDQTASKPPMEWMNGAFNRIDKNMLYLLQQGVPEWSEQVFYPVNAIIKYNGIIYIAKVENESANPISNVNKWTKLISDASTEHKGIVQLSSAIDSDSESQAATSLAVKKVYDRVETKFSKSGGLLGGSVKIAGELELNRNFCALTFSSPENNKKMILKNNNSDSFIMSYYDEKYWYEFFRFTAESKTIDFKYVNNININNTPLLMQGDYGIGTKGMVTSSMNRPMGSAFIAITSTDADKPKVNGGVCGFQSFSTNNGYGMQLISTNNANEQIRLFARTIENNKKVGEWTEILKQGDRGLFLHQQPCTKINDIQQITSMLSAERLFVKADDTKILPSTIAGYLLKVGARDVGGGGLYLFCEYIGGGSIWMGTNQSGDQPIIWNKIITDDAINSYLPVGIPQPWPSAIPPAGWLKCDGTGFDKNKYPLLAKVYPNGRLPDLRGEFIRGWDNGREVDIDRNILTAQSDQARNAVGFFYCKNRNSADNALIKRVETASHGGGEGNGSSSKHTIDFSNIWPTGDEFRPRNVAFMYIVKAA